MMTADSVRYYSATGRIHVHDDGSLAGPVTGRPDVELDKQTRNLMAQTSLSYREALSRVMDDPENADVVSAYSDLPENLRFIDPAARLPDIDAIIEKAAGNRADIEIAERAEDIAQNLGISLTEAARKVLVADPALAARYAAS